MKNLLVIVVVLFLVVFLVFMLVQLYIKNYIWKFEYLFILELGLYVLKVEKYEKVLEKLIVFVKMGNKEG